MTSTFETKADEWYAQDKPYDAEAIDAIRDRMGAIWDECSPMVSMWVKASSDEDVPGAGAGPGKFVSGVSPQCFFCRPFLLLPGTTGLKFYVYGRVQSPEASAAAYQSTLFASQGIEALSQPKTPNPSPTGDNFRIINESTSFAVHEVTIDFGLTVERPRYTMLQLWHRSVGPGVHTDAETNGSAGVGFPPIPPTAYQRRNTIADHEGVLSAMSTPQSAYVYRFEDVSRNVLAYHDILAITGEKYPTGGDAGTANTDSFILYPDISIRSSDVTTYSVEPISFFEYRAIGVKVLRDSTADYSLYRGDSDFFQPGRKTETIPPRALESAAQTLYSQIRPFGFGMAGTDTNMPTNGDQYLPMHEYLEHNTVKMMGLVLASERGLVATGGRRIDAKLEAEVMTLDSSGDPATVSVDYVDSVVAEKIFSFSYDAVTESANPNFTASFVPNSIISYWQVVDDDTSDTICENHMSEEDVNLLRNYARIVQLSINGYTNGDKYASVEDREFRVLRVSLTDLDGAIFGGTKLYVLPFFYLEREA